MIFRKGATLQTMCLNVIVEYLYTCKVPIEVFEQDVGFLRRVYSDELFELLKKRDSFLHDDHIDWLLTPYWKRVTLCIGISLSKVDILISKLKVMGNAITFLDLENSICSPAILKAVICCVPNVTDLNLKQTHCDDDLLKLIRTFCTSLTSLNLTNCHRITDLGMKNLCASTKSKHGYSSLKILKIKKTQVTVVGISYILNYITSLECLVAENLSSILYNMERSKDSPSTYNLTYFEHNWNVPLTEVLELWTQSCPFVTHVVIRGEVELKDFILLYKFSRLQSLRITGTFYQHRAPLVSTLISLQGEMLTELELKYSKVSIELIISYCKNLERLSMFNTKFENFIEQDINTEAHRLDKLRSISIKHIDFSVELYSKSINLLLRSSKSLTELVIKYARQFSKSLADVILELPNLTEVDFSITDITESIAMMFFTCDRMTKICLDMCPKMPDWEQSKLVMFASDSPSANTCSWIVEYNPVDSVSGYHSVWTGEID